MASSMCSMDGRGRSPGPLRDLRIINQVMKQNSPMKRYPATRCARSTDSRAVGLWASRDAANINQTAAAPRRINRTPKPRLMEAGNANKTFTLPSRNGDRAAHLVYSGIGILFLLAFETGLTCYPPARIPLKLLSFVVRE